MNKRNSLIAKEILRFNFTLLRGWLNEHHEINEEEYNEIYHYSSIDTCSKIINSCDLRLFDSKFCNDTQEYEEGRQYLSHFFSMFPPKFTKRDFKNNEDDMYNRYEYPDNPSDTFEKLRQLYDKYNNDWISYISCFSLPQKHNNQLLDNDNLSMWRGYGVDGQGACLSIAKLDLESKIEKVPGLFLLDVIYDDYQKDFFMKSLFRLAYDALRSDDKENNMMTSYLLYKHIGNNFENVKNDEILEAFAIAFECIPSFFKHEGFRDEREIRLIYIPDIHTRYDKRVKFIGNGHSARPYINFSKLVSDIKDGKLPILSITFGPDVCNQSYRDNFVLTYGRSTCEEMQINELYSKLPYRSKR